MDAQELCPICGEGHVTAQVQEIESDYKGHKAMLPLHYRLCNVCTSDFAGAPESKLNRRVLMAFRKRIDGLLTGAEITALRKQYQMTQGQAARLFGGGPVAFSKSAPGRSRANGPTRAPSPTCTPSASPSIWVNG